MDLLYRLHNSGGGFRPGQPVSIELPLGQSAERPVVPRAAVIWNGLGTTWVYVRTGPESFRRRRVELGSGDAESVSVRRGLKEGDLVVTIGAESLYGLEFAEQIQVEDDD